MALTDAFLIEVIGGNVSNNASTVNGTSDPTANWTKLSSVSVAIMASSFFSEILVLLTFLRHESLRTAFNIYLICLLVFDLANTCAFLPIQIVSDLYSSWWMGPGLCNLYIYEMWVLQAGMCNFHLLFTLNRIWAVTFPISYRTRHSKRVAVLSALAMLAYVHCLVLPGVILDALYYREPIEADGCLLNTAAQPIWSMAIQIVVFDIPMVIIILAYPIICYRTVGLQGAARGRVRKLRVANLSTNSGTVSMAGAVVGLKMTLRQRLRRMRKGRGPAFIVLTLMTLCALICYVPNQVYFTYVIFFGDDWPDLLRVGNILFALAGVADPLFLVLSLNDLRKKLTKMCRC
ncbi:hypothetical protein BV898_15266 [Hypsibius exemplaris]|uniref:G-protein coupled receptors family 1 profile domain-containing protein n=1 Tax=Hypsibius exemplaris TaxID=2072580 RepID=A0A9X6NAD1_HYPEX|nr:hypothetical protein BV898_15266 [Hypsibius exemplaris]